ncbi:MAG: hypothetical protein VX278_16420 [Myxococcota bacterium]|nr:hypothetical protein [Myxococcota bacterium]
MPERSTLVLGPSGVGKTALIASVNHASRMHRAVEDGLDVIIKGRNDETNTLFSQMHLLLEQGSVPFQGTSQIIDYHFWSKVIVPKTGLWGSLSGMFGSKYQEFKNDVFFTDSPGGATFPGDDGEIDYVVMGEYRARLTDRLKTASGVIICADASELNCPDENRGRVGGKFSAWLNQIFSQAAPKLSAGNPDPILSAERVYVCLNKCDLWALNGLYKANAQEAVEALDPLQFCHELLGRDFLRTIEAWFKPKTQVAFGFSSVYGFIDGGINARLIGAIQSKNGLRVEDIESWKPYQTLDPFVFLCSGLTLGQNIRICNAEDLRILRDE